MTGKTHFVGGAVAGLLYLRFTNTLPTPTTTGYILASAFAGLIPDIDSVETHGGQLLYPVSAPWNFIRDKVKKAKLHWLGDFFEHRGFTHCLLIPILLFVLSLIYKDPIIPFILYGYLSHLILDYNNDRGIPLLGPFHWYHFHLLTITTGGRKSSNPKKKYINVENIVYWILWATVAIIILNLKGVIVIG